jgi:HEAT repeat protein
MKDYTYTEKDLAVNLKYKKYFNLHISGGHLYAMNIRMKSSIFTDQIMDYMQILDINDILFESGISAEQLASFLDRFAKKLPATDYRNQMTTHLKENKIDTVHVGTELGYDLFEKGRQFRGELIGDFSVRHIVCQLIGGSFEELAHMLEAEDLPFEIYLSRFNFDYYFPLVAYLIPEGIAAIDTEPLIDLLSRRLGEMVGDSNEVVDIELPEWEWAKRLIAALNYHADREEILHKVGENLVAMGVGRDIYSQLLPKASAIKIESSEEIDQFVYSTFNQALPGYSPDGFDDLFSRLLRTGQQGKARSVINIILNYLAGPDLDLREKALVLFRYVLDSYRKMSDDFLAKHLIDKIDEYISEGKETFEFSDLIWELAQITLAEKNYERLSAICDVLLKKRTQELGIWSYESVVVKKSIEELNRREVITQLVNDLVTVSHATAQYLRNILITIGSEEAALALSDIISHEKRQVRQHVLRVLSAMGKSSLNVFTEAMKNNAYFERAMNRRELPDEKWYVVRNSIFVLGSLKDPAACRALRDRIGDDDTRVRRSIVEALEKIGGEEAVDLLMVIASDPDREIREAAIIAIGLVGNGDNVLELSDLALKHPSEIIYIISAVGKLGGPEAKTFLGELLNNSENQSIFTSGRSSREELKMAAIRALGRIGDNDSLDKIREFDENLSASQKLFFGGSKLNKAAQEILNRRDK